MYNIYEQKRCARCILPSDFPNISFDENGVCNYCRNWDKSWKNFDYLKAEQKLIKIFEEAKSKKRQYDCLIPFSGGRDSSYVLLLAKKKYKLNPLVVTFNNGFLSEFALKNILNSVKILGVDHILHSYNWDHLKRMYQSTVKNSGEFCSICANGINYVKIVYQKKYDIPLLISGGSSRVDEQSPFEIISSHPKYVKNVLRKDAFSEDEINNFILPRRYDLNAIDQIKNKIKKDDYVRISLPDFMPWNLDKIQDILMKELNWKTPNKKDDHIDCKYANVKTYFKNQQIPGFVFKQAKYSQLIRDGQLTREEALVQLQVLIEKEQEPANLNEFIEELELSSDDIKNLDKKSHLNFINKNNLKDKESFLYKAIAMPYRLVKSL